MLRKEDGDAKELKENIFSLTLVLFFTQGANVYSFMIHIQGVSIPKQNQPSRLQLLKRRIFCGIELVFRMSEYYPTS